MTEEEQEAYDKARGKILDGVKRMERGEEVPSLSNALAWKSLVALPPEIGRLTALKTLALNNNRLTELPPEIGLLSTLTELTLNDNRLTELPPEIGLLRTLMVLHLQDNRLTELPPEIGRLAALKVLNLKGNRLTELPHSLRQCNALEKLYLHGTPLELEIPESVLGPTCQDVDEKKAAPARPRDILDYYFSTRRGARPLDEARVLVVGRGEAGKTSLCRVLSGQSFREEEGETAGIEIGRLRVPGEAGGITLHLWDFAGQEITYALHRFFLAQHALYLLVLDNRAGTAARDAEDWLRTIAAYAGRAAVILVMTKQDKHPFHLDTEKLRRRWGGKFASMDFARTDAKTNRGLPDLLRLLARTAAAMPETRQPFPLEYQDVKARCEEMKARGDKRLSLEAFRELCLLHGVQEADGASAAERAEGLARILHNLGVVLHFVDDPRLRENTVLDPQWVTNGVYRLLRAREKAAEEAEARGAGAAEAVLTLAKARAALPEEDEGAVLFLLYLMERFEMIHVLEEGTSDEDRSWFLPAVLPEYQPDLTPDLISWREADATELRLRFTYPLLPEGLVPRFIVRTWPLNEEMPRWRTGCFLREGRAQALISGERLDRTVEITVRGPEEDRVRLGRLVSRHMEAIHRDVPEPPKGEILLRVDVGGKEEEVWKNIEVLEKDEAATEKGQSSVETSEGTRPVEAGVVLEKLSARLRRDWLHGQDAVREAVGGEGELDPRLPLGGKVRGRRAAKEPRGSGADQVTEPARVFVSYAHRDKRACDVLMQNLSVMEQDGLIEAWTDNMIPSGTEWDEEIKKRLNEADLFVALVTTPFLSSKYIKDTEIPLALARHKEGKLKLAWVIVEQDCAWKKQEFAKLQVILPGGRAVRQWRRMQDAFNAVEKMLRQMVARGGE